MEHFLCTHKQLNSFVVCRLSEIHVNRFTLKMAFYEWERKENKRYVEEFAKNEFGKFAYKSHLGETN